MEPETELEVGDRGPTPALPRPQPLVEEAEVNEILEILVEEEVELAFGMLVEVEA